MPWPTLDPEDAARADSFQPIDIMIDDLCLWLGSLEQDRAIAVMRHIIRRHFRALLTGKGPFADLIRKHSRRLEAITMTPSLEEQNQRNFAEIKRRHDEYHIAAHKKKL